MVHGRPGGRGWLVGCFLLRLWRKVVYTVAQREWARRQLVGTAGSCEERSEGSFHLVRPLWQVWIWGLAQRQAGGSAATGLVTGRLVNAHVVETQAEACKARCSDVRKQLSLAGDLPLVPPPPQSLAQASEVFFDAVLVRIEWAGRFQVRDDHEPTL